MEGRIEEVKEMGKGGGRRGERKLEVKLENIQVKSDIMWSERKLRKEKIWVEDDWTWEERRMQWNLRRIGEEEGKNIWVRYGKIKIDGNTLW